MRFFFLSAYKTSFYLSPYGLGAVTTNFPGLYSSTGFDMLGVLVCYNNQIKKDLFLCYFMYLFNINGTFIRLVLLQGFFFFR